ncbi:MAG: family 20 glycosylhydrolase [Clostridia bacterium]|nr:family 20 glycosylhydrolase [Clostridia bacterium]
MGVSLDGYVKQTEDKFQLNVNTKIQTDNNIIRDLLKKQCKNDGEENYIRFSSGIPEEISSRIQDYKKTDDEYIICVEKNILIYSDSESGLFYAANALIRYINNGEITGGIIYEYPCLPFRCVKVYTPSEDNCEYFKEFVDLCAFYGYNKIMIETGGAMEYKNHPEINKGWVRYCERFKDYQGQSLDIQNSAGWARNSIHMENGGGGYISREKMKELVAYCEERYFEVIPELPLLSHCDYMLTAHDELKERKEDDLPDTYCTSKPEVYKLAFELIDEIIDVFHPRMIHIGHDEYFSIGLCDKCRSIPGEKLYADDVNRIYNYLEQRSVKTALWGDKLLNAIGKKGQTWGGSRRVIVSQVNGDFLEEVPSTYKAIDMIPDDICVFHWYWGIKREWEEEFIKRNMPVVFGNFDGMAMIDWESRRRNIEGICISNWSMMNAEHVQRNNVLMNLAYSSKMLWCRNFDENNFKENLLFIAAELYNYRKSKLKNYIEITHRTTEFKTHKKFVDGFMIDKKSDYSGKYILETESGEKYEICVYYNLNIGTKQVNFERKMSEEADTYIYDEQLLEPAYSCEIIETDEGVFYKCAFENNNAGIVSRITLKEGRDIQIREINILT